jgi:hypothetical protein
MIVDLEQEKKQLENYILLAQDANEFIQQNYPDYITHSLIGREIERMAGYMKDSRFEKIMYLYGYKYLLAILQYFTDQEKYELCSKIVKAINNHNATVNDKIPTSLSHIKEAVMA